MNHMASNSPSTEEWVRAYRTAAELLPVKVRLRPDSNRWEVTAWAENYRRMAAIPENRAFIIQRITERMYSDPLFFLAVSEYALAARADLLGVIPHG